MTTFVFDLDGTIADVGKRASSIVIEKIKELNGRIVVCSGKPVYYLCGFLRQAGLYDAVMIGENGAVLQFGVDLPPLRLEQNYSRLAKENLCKIKTEIDKTYPAMWYQPNEVCVTPFPTSEEQFKKIDEMLKGNPSLLEDVDMYVHFDSIDFSPKGVSKATALKLLADFYKEDIKSFVAIGDGNNDYPMFAVAGKSVGINLSDRSKATLNFKTIEEALDYLIINGD